MLKPSWSTKKLGDKDYFEILGSRIDKFNGEKEYLSTSSIDKNKIVAIEEIITYQKRPSRANMQPRLNSVWFAKMKNTVKIYSFSEENKNEITKYILSTGFAGILCNVKEVYSKYLEKMFLSKWFNDLKDKSTHGSTQQAINNQEIKDFEIPLPSLPEQKKIVYVLDAIQEAINVQEKIIEKTKELKRVTMKKLFYKGIRGEELKKMEIEKIPMSWRLVKFGDSDIEIIDGDRGINYPKQEDFSKNGYCLFLNTGNVPGEKFDFSECHFITREKDEVLRKGKLNRGDLVMTTRGTIGNLSAYDQSVRFENIRINSGMVIFRNPNKCFDSRYLLYLLISPIIKQQFTQFMSGSTQQQIPIGTLKDIRLIMPQKIEQREIAEILQTIDQKIEIEQKKKTLYEELFKTMLNKLMNREIRTDNLKI